MLWGRARRLDPAPAPGARAVRTAPTRQVPNVTTRTSQGRAPGRSARPLPDLGDLSGPGRRAVLAVLRRNRRAFARHGATACGDEWTAGLLAGLYAAGALRSRAEVTRVARLVSDDIIVTAMTRPRREPARRGTPSRSPTTA